MHFSLFKQGTKAFIKKLFSVKSINIRFDLTLFSNISTLSSDNGVTHNYNAKDNTKSNWCTAYFHCGPCPNKMTSKFQ